jgi:class 3 adenylate cyclase/tetratricopeptide (TPR) repeat protein
VEEQRKTVTVVFADVTGSTGLGERLDPESLRHVMQRYFHEMQAVLEGHGGTVEKFIGDAVMAVFGIPQVHEDDALRAVRAAAGMRARLAELNSELESKWAVRLEMRVGVNTGEVVAGAAAAGQAFVTGDAVNVAARLEETAAPGDILLGETTYGLVRDAVRADPLGEDLDLRGKSQACRAWHLLEVLPGLPGRLRRVDAPMVGRERELDLLRQAYERSAQEQTCHLFTVLGPAGIGKSRLVREFVSRLPGEARVAQGRCLPYGEGITYWPVAEVVKELAGIGEEQSPEEARARLGELTSDESDAAVAAKLAAVIGLGDGSAATEEAFWALRRLLESQAGSGPVVVVFDDIQWGEETFLDLIEYLVDWSRDAPILVVCLARPELLDVRPGWAGGKLNATTVLLEQLPGDDCSRLVENLLGEGELAEDARQRIADRAAGNPLFIEELLSMLIDEGVLERENGRWSVASDLEAVGVPGTIQALLAARLDRLPPDERRVIERGAVEGEVFHADAVSALLDEVADPARELRSLVRHEILRPVRETLGAGEAFRFRHLLIRDAAYAGIPKGVRADLHARFADWLERAAGDRSSEYEEILGYHLEQAYGFRVELAPQDEAAAALAKRAAYWLGAAGRRATARGDMPAATRLLERATALMPPENTERLELELTLGWALQQAGEFSRAEKLFGSVSAAAAARGDRGLELRGLLARMEVRNVLQSEGSAGATLELVDEVVPELERLGDDQGLARAWRLRSYADISFCRYGAAAEALERSLAHAERAGNDAVRSEVLGWLPTRIFRGPMHADPALRRCRELLERAEGDRPAEAGALAGIALLEAISGRFPEARAAEARSRAIKEELGLGFLLAVGLIWRAEIEAFAGDAVAAERAARAAAEFLGARGETGFYPTASLLLADALLLQGRLEEAQEALRAAETAMASDDFFSVVMADRVGAKLFAVQGHTAEAEEAASRAVELGLQTDDLTLWSEAYLTLAEVVAEGQPAAAREALQEALSAAERKGNVVLAGRARERLAALGSA